MSVIEGVYINAVVQDASGRFKEMVYRPHAFFMFKIGHNFTRPIAGLIDSGADRNLFPAVIGENIGIKVKNGEKNVAYGIGNQPVNTYRHSVDLYFDAGYHFNAEIDFSYEMEVVLLGGIGFFDKFRRITLNKKDEIVELEF